MNRPVILGGIAGIGAAYYFYSGSKQETKPSAPGQDVTVSPQEAAKAPSALDPNSWTSFKVTQKEPITHNTYRLRFAFPDKNAVVGLPVASCLVTKANIGDEKEDGTRKPVIRPYTPSNLGNTKGYLDLVVKGYPNGLMSKHITELNVGDELEFKGPIPKLPYKANMKKRIGMIAGGSGLTPMLQIVDEIARNPEDKTEVSFIFANQTADDIILKQEIDDIAQKHDNVKVVYFVDKALEGKPWEGEVGYITPEKAKKILPPPSDDTLILVCGPPPMMKAISGDKAPDKSQGDLSGILQKLGYSANQVYKF